jgi:hypothetical protein
MRRPASNLLTGNLFIRKTRTPVFFAEFTFILSSIARVSAKRNSRDVPQQFSHALKLIVRQGVHWVHDYRPDPWAWIPGGIIQKGQQKTLCLATPCSSSDNHIPSALDQAHARNLVSIKRTINIQS